jgi:hypothetical protein
MLQEVTDGVVTKGRIAFDRDRPIIFTTDYPKGLARNTFLDTLPESLRPIATRAFDTFIRLHPILNAAIDTCRPYPPFVNYGTDDEIDRIEAARRIFAQQVGHLMTIRPSCML